MASYVWIGLVIIVVAFTLPWWARLFWKLVGRDSEGDEW